MKIRDIYFFTVTTYFFFQKIQFFSDSFLSGFCKFATSPFYPFS